MSGTIFPKLFYHELPRSKLPRPDADGGSKTSLPRGTLSRKASSLALATPTSSSGNSSSNGNANDEEDKIQEEEEEEVDKQEDEEEDS